MPLSSLGRCHEAGSDGFVGGRVCVVADRCVRVGADVRTLGIVAALAFGTAGFYVLLVVGLRAIAEDIDGYDWGED